MKSIADLEAIRQKTLAEVSLRTNQEGLRIVVGMATCGIAAGARPVLNAFIEELRRRNINNVQVTMTGCIGVCRLEPMAEVLAPDGTKTTYVKLNAEMAQQIVAEHIVNGRVCTPFTIGAVEGEGK